MIDRTSWMNLRGVKLGIITLSILSASFLGVLVQPQPVRAEGFLSRTIDCVFGVLKLQDCRTSPSNAPKQTAPKKQDQQNQTQQQTQTTQTDKTTTQDKPEVTPISKDHIPGDVKEIQPLPRNVTRPSGVAQQNARTASPSNQRSFIDQNGVLGIQATADKPATAEGWYIFGVAWYWWLVVIGGILTLVAIWKNRGNYKEYLSIVKSKLQ